MYSALICFYYLINLKEGEQLLNIHLKKSWAFKLLLMITTSIVLVFIMNHAQAVEGVTRLKALESAVFYDKNTGLEWYAGPDKSTTWNEAKAWVESLNVAGGDWRMPTREELKTLYKKRAGDRNMTPLLKTTGWWVWGEARDSLSAWFFDFEDGGEIWGYRGTSHSFFRGFAVRSRK